MAVQTDETTSTAPSRLRRIAFRVVAVLVALWLTAMYLIAATNLGLMWLPADIDAGAAQDPQNDIRTYLADRAHFFATGVSALAILLCAYAQWRAPQRRTGSMLLLVIAAVTAAIVFAFQGTVAEWLVEEGLLLGPVLALAALHPRARDLVRLPRPDRVLIVPALVGATGWLAYAVINALAQATGDPGDVHVVGEHFGVVSLMAVILAAGALIGATSHAGRWLPAWISVGGTLLISIHSLVFAGAPFVMPPIVAVAAVLWALVFGTLLVRRARERS